MMNEDKRQAASILETEIAEWQTKIDAAKLQMHLGARDARDKLQPQLQRLEDELSQAKAEWNELQKASEGAWDDVHHGLKLSLKAMQRSFDKARQHFDAPEERNK